MAKAALAWKGEFSAAHMLTDKKWGKCRNLHGHNWRVMIAFDENVNNPVNFSDIKALIGKLDHKLLVWNGIVKGIGDRRYIIENSNGIKVAIPADSVVLLEDEPTCEVIAKYIYEMIVKAFNVRGLMVTVCEDSNSCVTYPA